MKSDLEKRWVIEAQRMSTGKFLLQMDELAKKLTGKKFCKRGSISAWLGTAKATPLRHLSVLCKMVMEYVIATSPFKCLVYTGTNKLRRRLIEEEWPKKFKA